MKATFKLFTILIFTNLLIAQNNQYPISIKTSNQNSKVLTIQGNGEECNMIYDIRNNTLLQSNCKTITNSKGIQIHCTQNKKVCKTQSEVNNALIDTTARQSKKDKPYTHLMLHENTTYACVPTVRFILDGSNDKRKLTQKEAEKFAFFFRYEGDTLNLGVANGKTRSAVYKESGEIGGGISGDLYLEHFDEGGFSIIYSISLGKTNTNGKSFIPLVRVLVNDDGSAIKNKYKMLYFNCSNTID